MCASCDTDYQGTIEAVWDADLEIGAKSTTVRRIIHLYHEGFTAAQISEFFRSRYWTRDIPSAKVTLERVEYFIEVFA